MKKFFQLTEEKLMVFLVVLSILNYFFPMLYPQAADVAEFGIPLPFYKAYLMPLPLGVPTDQASVFSVWWLVVDVLFAYVLGCFVVFAENKIREGGFPTFRWILRIAVAAAIIFFVARFL